MAESVKRLKANRVIAGKACGWCAQPMQFGEDAAVCESCTAAYHAPCWDGKGGCAVEGCPNAPLRQIAPPPAPGHAAPLRPGMMYCPHCGKVMSKMTRICTGCGMAPSPDGVYHGPLLNAPGATASLVTGIIGLVIFGVILGPVAIAQAAKAKAAIARDRTLGGGGMATAGLILGILDLVGWVIFIVTRFTVR